MGLLEGAVLPVFDFTGLLGTVFLVVLAVAWDTETEVNEKKTEIYCKMSCHLAVLCMSYM